MTQDEWLTRQEVAKRMKVPPATLAQWASQGRGPRYALFGRHCRYKLDDVIRWENAQFGGADSLETDPVVQEQTTPCVSRD